MDKQPGIFGLPHCMEYADRALRPELVLRGPELKKRGLDLAGNWADNTAEELHRELLQKLEFAEAMQVVRAPEVMPLKQLDRVPVEFEVREGAVFPF